jgi:putative ABC transport system permease protein
VFVTANVPTVTPVIYGLSNVILRSARTSDPANLAAVRPKEFATVAPVDVETKTILGKIAADPSKIAVSRDMADFLRAEVGDKLEVVLVRATKQQVNVVLHIAALYERLPGFPDGVDAVMSIDRHVREVPSKVPDFFLAQSRGAGNDNLKQAVASLNTTSGASHVRIDSRASTLDRDQSSLAALNVSGLVDLDSGFALAMAVVAIVIFVFGLLLQRRREYITLRALGIEFRGIRTLVIAEASAVAIGGAAAGILTGAAMAYYFVRILRPLFVLAPSYSIPIHALVTPAFLLLVATLIASLVGSRLLARMSPTELLRDE